jgi:hypothetical protein
MSKAQTDIRATSYNAATANPNGYTGTIDDAIAQIRAEPDEVRVPWTFNMSREHYELLGFLRVLRSKTELSGVQVEVGMPAVYVFPMNEDEDWSVDYGAPEAAEEPGKYSLERALRDWPHNFQQ